MGASAADSADSPPAHCYTFHFVIQFRFLA